MVRLNIHPSVSNLSRVCEPRQPRSCPQTGYQNWFGTARVMKQGPRATESQRMREILKMSQGCHTCNQTAQHPVVKHPAVCSHQVSLMKRKFFRVGQVNRSKHHPPDVTEAKKLVFLAITIQMGHFTQDKLTHSWATTNQFHTSFYSSAMKWDRYFHILCFLHFTDNKICLT